MSRSVLSFGLLAALALLVGPAASADKGAQPRPAATAVREAQPDRPTTLERVRPQATRAAEREIRRVRPDLTLEITAPTRRRAPATLIVRNQGDAPTSQQASVQTVAESSCEAGRHRDMLRVTPSLAWAPPLAPGATFQVEVRPESGKWTPGCYTELRVLVDGVAAIDEADEDNNLVKTTFCATTECY